MGSNPILSAKEFDQKLDVFKQKKIIEKKIKYHQISIDLFRLFNIREFLHFIKKFKNVINNFPKKIIWQKIIQVIRQTL